jgi:hypothetical protein
MLGLRFIKVPPTTYLLQYRNGAIAREGAGLSFFYFAPTTSLVAVPMASVDVPFIFKEVTADFQDVSVQGQVSYRVEDPTQLAQTLDFTLDPHSLRYENDDPDLLPQRIINQVQVLTRGELGRMNLREALAASDDMATTVRNRLAGSSVLTDLGLTVGDLSFLAIKPNPDTARALEAEVRETMLKDADEAIYARRNAAVEQERCIRENELNTEIAVEEKQRQIRETQMEAERAVQEKQRVIAEENMGGKITLEEKNKELVELATDNARAEADARAYAVAATMAAVAQTDPKVLQVLGSMNMDPAQLIANAFRDLAENADKVGNLNVSPELLEQLMRRAG